MNASLYTTVWTHAWRQQRTYLEKYYHEREQNIALPPGIAIWDGALYFVRLAPFFEDHNTPKEGVVKLSAVSLSSIKPDLAGLPSVDR